MSLIPNAKDRPLNVNSGTMPDVSGALLDWFQPITFGVVTKTVVGFKVSETMEEIVTEGVWQPLNDRALMMKPEGQRQWGWFQLHALPTLVLETDQVIVYLGVQYRVMAQRDYRLNGYVEYHLTDDFTGAGPAVVTP